MLCGDESCCSNLSMLKIACGTAIRNNHLKFVFITKRKARMGLKKAKFKTREVSGNKKYLTSHHISAKKQQAVPPFQ